MNENKKTPEIFSLADRLVSLILEMSEEQQEVLLRELESKLAKEQRRHQRMPLYTSVDYALENRVYRDFIKNISKGGVFIQSSRELPVGQKIVMIFSIPGYEKHVKLRGHIVRADDTGIGVKFEGKNALEMLPAESISNISHEKDP